MNKSISIIQRFLLPIAILIIAGALILAERESSQETRHIKEEAHSQSAALIRLLNVTEVLVGDQVASALRVLRERGEARGMPAIQGTTRVGDKLVPNLMLGNEAQANRYELVDSVTTQLGGTATLFVKSGDEFVRVSTNILKEDGTRAIGTVLNPKGKALAEISRGKAFYGVVDILGETYISGYEPMRNQNGEIVGIWYVGYKVDMKVLRKAVENTRYLQTGFSAVLDDKQQIHFLSAHISRETAQDILRQRPAGWTVISEDIPGWGFKVLIAYPKIEAQAVGLIKSLYVIVVGGLLGFILIAIIVLLLKRLVLQPLGGDPSEVAELVSRISVGDLHDDKLYAPPGTLMANMLKMRENLREMVSIMQQNADSLGLAASVFEHAHDGIFITDSGMRIIEVNSAFIRLTGWSREEALGSTPQALKFSAHDVDFFQRIWGHPESSGLWHGETWNETKEGKLYAAWLDLFIVRNADGDISHHVGVFSDMTLLKEQQQNLERMAYHDPLTQLPNRALFFDRLQQVLSRARRSGELLAICYLDLDGFKPVNDTFGHEAGDQLLIELAQRIRSCLRAGDTVARLGGDEFVLLLCDMQTTGECKPTLERLLASIAAPYQLGSKIVTVTASIGYTLYPLDNVTPETLLRHADQAMYSVKLNGGGSYSQFQHLNQVNAEAS